LPFEDIAADLIGLWSINIAAQPLQIQALMIIDTATTLTEVVVGIKDHSRSMYQICSTTIGLLVIPVPSNAFLIKVVNSLVAPFNLGSYKMGFIPQFKQL
jgi:hypothetical protein